MSPASTSVVESVPIVVPLGAFSATVAVEIATADGASFASVTGSTRSALTGMLPSRLSSTATTVTSNCDVASWSRIVPARR